MTDTLRPVMLVVGGTGSIGREIVAQALEAGWAVIAHGRSTASVAALLARFDCDQSPLVGYAADAFAPDGAATIIARASNFHSRIDAVVDCVSGGPPGATGRFAETTPQAYAGLLDASVAHLQRLAHAALPWLARQGGTLIAFASDAGRFSAPGQATIGASRAAIMGFVRNLALEVARDGIRVHCIAPAFVEQSASLVRTEARTPDRVAKARTRAGLGLPTPADIAPLVLFLCGDGARKISGQVISVNGGMNA
jgi:NAD(P)-dependent dehydrogenase (short-subunit alcohol dehydrogenase family)